MRDRSLANTWFKVAVRHLKIRNPKIRVSFTLPTLRTIFKILKQLLRDLDAHFKPLTHEFNQ